MTGPAGVIAAMIHWAAPHDAPALVVRPLGGAPSQARDSDSESPPILLAIMTRMRRLVPEADLVAHWQVRPASAARRVQDSQARSGRVAARCHHTQPRRAERHGTLLSARRTNHRAHMHTSKVILGLHAPG